MKTSVRLRKAVWVLLTVATTFWVICAVLNGFPFGHRFAYPTRLHFGWIGTLFASLGGLSAVVFSYQNEEKVVTRGRPVYKSESPIQFFFAYACVGLFLVVAAVLSVLGVLGLADGNT